MLELLKFEVERVLSMVVEVDEKAGKVKMNLSTDIAASEKKLQR